MADDELSRWRAEVVVRAGYDSLGPWLLPHDGSVTLGRAKRCGLRSDHPAISQKLAIFTPSPLGWVLENGARTRVRVASVFVLQGSFAPRARVLLQPADWTLSWDLDVLAEVTIKYRPVGHGSPYPTAHDAPEAADLAEQLVGTDLVGQKVTLTPLQKRRLGALFAYLIEGRPKPDQLLETAAALSGEPVKQINRTWVKVRDKINNNGRGIRIERIEDLGYYLVEVAGVITDADVPRPKG